MKDRELIELAAKSAGITGYRYSDGFGCMAHWNESDGGWFDACCLWNPLTDDGDALRLAVKLSIHIRLWQYACEAEDNDGRSTGMIHARECSGDMGAATRRAIVLAAAEIGRGM